jgi:hypothetical protein
MVNTSSVLISKKSLSWYFFLEFVSRDEMSIDEGEEI